MRVPRPTLAPTTRATYRATTERSPGFPLCAHSAGEAKVATRSRARSRSGREPDVRVGVWVSAMLNQTA